MNSSGNAETQSMMRRYEGHRAQIHCAETPQSCDKKRAAELVYGTDRDFTFVGPDDYIFDKRK